MEMLELVVEGGEFLFLVRLILLRHLLKRALIIRVAEIHLAHAKVVSAINIVVVRIKFKQSIIVFLIILADLLL